MSLTRAVHRCPRPRLAASLPRNVPKREGETRVASGIFFLFWFFNQYLRNKSGQFFLKSTHFQSRQVGMTYKEVALVYMM
jgi:hypothetical protein